MAKTLLPLSAPSLLGELMYHYVETRCLPTDRDSSVEAFQGRPGNDSVSREEL